jgi:23S rRNA (adenine2503-C2)-methyltransferase
VINLMNLSLKRLEAWVTSQGHSRYRATQLIQWIHQRGVLNWDEMSNLSKDFRAFLKENAVIEVPEVALEQMSPDGTCKWLLRLKEGNAIETVYIPETNRGTLCISSQVGCALNCSFCSTGKEGFNRNLELFEIIGQLWIARDRLKTLYPERHTPITNVVMMGMGEPLLNYQSVLSATELMLCDHAYKLSKYRVTISTAGVVPVMQQLSKESDVSLAVSLHAPNNALRNELVPLNKKYPLEVLMETCRNYFPKDSRRRIMFEYVMLAGVNDSLAHAKELVKLLKGIPCKLNLIPFNPFPKSRYQTSTPEAVSQFQDYFINAGIGAWVRKERGGKIDAACGQLAGQFDDRTGRRARFQKTGFLRPV